ncbi:hypothetical protein BD289DRAFT_20307 [Coniella lustricola]|uniref:Secreted protein n=1 Tax=Coniella lustricola TaxID=2025994 RepID=A0A2T3AJI9_9PEZI|nr:hypothetical protein BD289DRAFT_20307 [Coniella lustricola]
MFRLFLSLRCLCHILFLAFSPSILTLIFSNSPRFCKIINVFLPFPNTTQQIQKQKDKKKGAKTKMLNVSVPLLVFSPHLSQMRAPPGGPTLPCRLPFLAPRDSFFPRHNFMLHIVVKYIR